jgi:hypothetical protein
MLYNLFKAMFIMVKNDASKPPMSKFIGRRLLLSAGMVLLLLIGILTGLITPNPHP